MKITQLTPDLLVITNNPLLFLVAGSMFLIVGLITLLTSNHKLPSFLEWGFAVGGVILVLSYRLSKYSFDNTTHTIIFSSSGFLGRKKDTYLFTQLAAIKYSPNTYDGTSHLALILQDK